MVAFARAKAKSIFLKLRLKEIYKPLFKTHDRGKIEELSNKKKKDSTHFIEAIKDGGVWLS